MSADRYDNLPEAEIIPGLPTLVDVKTLERATSFKPVTWRVWERAGKIRGYRIGGRLRFAVADVREFLSRQSGRRTPPPELLQKSGQYRRRKKKAA